MDQNRIESAAKAFNRGETDAFGIVFDALSESIFRYVGYRTEDPNEREEIVSDVFFRILRSGKIPEDADGLRRFSYAVARNAVIDRYRTRKPASQDISEADAFGLVRHEEDHAAKIDDRAAIERVLGHLETVNPEHKEILILRIWDDLPYDDIAAITGKSVDNCKKIVSRTLEGIRANVAYVLFFALLIR